MVTQQTIDIFAAPIDVLVHQANCFHTMGSGIARAIRERFPEAYEADCKTPKGALSKLGTYSTAIVKSPVNAEALRLKYIINLYSQFDYGRDKRYTNYEAIAIGMTNLRESVILKGKSDYVLGMPWKYGCNIAGGDWGVVEAIIKSVFESSPINVLICKHPDAEVLNTSILATPSQKPK